MLFLLFVVAFSTIAVAFADESIGLAKPAVSFPNGDALQFVNQFIRKVSGKNESPLGKEFRDTDGNLRKVPTTIVTSASTPS